MQVMNPAPCADLINKKNPPAAATTEGKVCI